MTNEIVPLPSENEVVGEIVDDFTLSDTIDRDAKEFGKHIRLGGFHLGELVARNCYPRKGQGQRTDLENEPWAPVPEVASGKVSLRKFAQLAGVAQRTVSYHYAAWELAAEEGICTPAAHLNPGDDDPLLKALTEEDDEITRHMWLAYFHRARRPKPKSPKKRKTMTEIRINAAAYAAMVGLTRGTALIVRFADRVTKTFAALNPDDDDVDHDELRVELQAQRDVLSAQMDKIDQTLASMGETACGVRPPHLDELSDG